MEDIKVGEYIRTKDGIIAKIIYKDDLMIDCDNDVFDLRNLNMMEIPTEFVEEYIIKHSKNIIDLIEEDDILFYKLSKSEILHFGKVINYKTGLGIDFYSLEQLNIKTILTKEMLENNCYKVGK